MQQSASNINSSGAAVNGSLHTAFPSPGFRLRTRAVEPCARVEPWRGAVQQEGARRAAPAEAIAGAGLPGPLANSRRPSSDGSNRASPAASDEISLTLKRYNTQRIKLCSDWRQLARVVAVHGHHFNTINTCAALVHLAQLGPGPQQPHPSSSGGSSSTAAAIDEYAAYEALLQQLLQMACGLVPQLQARQVANVMWASATLSVGYTGGHPLCRDLLQQLLPASVAWLPWSNAQELANSIWALATVGVSPDDRWLLQFLNCAETALPYTSCQDLATMVWSLHTLGVSPDEEWLGAYAKRVRDVGAHLTHRDAAQILAAMVHLGVDLVALDSELVVVLRGRLTEGGDGRQQQQQQRGARGRGGAAGGWRIGGV